MNITAHIVSFIIPVYNRENVIEECIQSVQAQTYQQFEIILIDDGSTDNTVAICKDLAAQDARIKLFTTEHLGVSGARNIGLDHACGEFVFFLDSDDVIHPQLLEVLVSAMQENGAAVGGTRCAPCREATWTQGKERFMQARPTFEITYHDHPQALDAIFKGNSPLNMIGGVMIRRDWIGDARFRTDLFIGEDFYFIYQNLVKGADAIFLKQCGYLNRLHDSNTSWQYDFNGFWTRFYRRKLVWESEESLGRSEYATRQKENAFHCFVLCFQKNRPYSTDGRKMLAVLREHRQEILPALPLKTRILCQMYLLCPGSTWFFFRLKNRFKAAIQKTKKKATQKN